MANAYSLSAGPRTATMRRSVRMSMAAKRAAPFNPKTFLAQAGDSRTTLQCQKHQILFAQGDTMLARESAVSRAGTGPFQRLARMS